MNYNQLRAAGSDLFRLLEKPFGGELKWEDKVKTATHAIVEAVFGPLQSEEDRDSDSFERIADALELLVIVADQFATARALESMKHYAAAPPIVRCPYCDCREFGNPQPKEGQKVTCPICRRVFTVPTDPGRPFADPGDIDKAPPIFDPQRRDMETHRFVPVTDNRYCGECGGGKLHPIHRACSGHFDVANGGECPRCGIIVKRDALGREIEP